MASARYVLGTTHVIPQRLETLSNNLPCTAAIVPLEISNVLKDDVPGAPALDDVAYLIEEGPTGLVAPPQLRTGLRKGLTRESSAQDVMGWYLLL